MQRNSDAGEILKIGLFAINTIEIGTELVYNYTLRGTIKPDWYKAEKPKTKKKAKTNPRIRAKKKAKEDKKRKKPECATISSEEPVSVIFSVFVI